MRPADPFETRDNRHDCSFLKRVGWIAEAPGAGAVEAYGNTAHHGAGESETGCWVNKPLRGPASPRVVIQDGPEKTAPGHHGNRLHRRLPGPELRGLFSAPPETGKPTGPTTAHAIA